MDMSSKLNFNWSFDWSDVIAVVAILLSLYTFFKQKKENMAAIRVVVESKGNEVKIVLDNVGNSIVKVLCSSFTFNYNDGRNSISKDNIAPFFMD